MWDTLDSLSARFVVPLRRLLGETTTQCRNEVRRKQQEMKDAKQRGREKGSGPAVSVEIANDGGCLPEPSLPDELEVYCGVVSVQGVFVMSVFFQMLQVAQQQMDMMKSVLVRVEELMHNLF